MTGKIPLPSGGDFFCKRVFKCFAGIPCQGHLLFSGGICQAKMRSLISSFYDGALHLRFADGIAKPIICMCIAKSIYMGAIYKISLAFNAYGQVAAWAFQIKLALAAGGFCPLQGFCFVLLGGTGRAALGSSSMGRKEKAKGK